MTATPKRSQGRPPLPGPKPVRVTAYIPPAYFTDLQAMAREDHRATAYTAAEILKRAVDEYRLARAVALKPATPIVQDGAYEIQDPKETPDEIIQAAAQDVAKGKT
jgi:hypothetical protein